MTTLRLQSTLTFESRDNFLADQTTGRASALFAQRRPVSRLGLQRRSRRLRNCARQFKTVLNALQSQVTGQGVDSGASIDGADAVVCRALRLEGPDELQDFIASLILSECVYKKLELDEEGVVAKVAEYASQFPPGWVQLETVQLSLSGIPQHYLIATSPTSMYVAFMGTKQFQDILADANLLHTPVWAESARLAVDQQSIPAAHRGFLDRARAIHVEQLYELAVSRGLRLVLCGHSLGGAVAKLCTLRLLRELPDWPRPRVRCVAFATPAVGNSALAELVESAGWAAHFATYYLPEDQLVRLISFSQARTTSSGIGSSTAACSSSGTGSRSNKSSGNSSTTILGGGGGGQPAARAADGSTDSGGRCGSRAGVVSRDQRVSSGRRAAEGRSHCRTAGAEAGLSSGMSVLAGRFNARTTSLAGGGGCPQVAGGAVASPSLVPSAAPPAMVRVPSYSSLSSKAGDRSSSSNISSSGDGGYSSNISSSINSLGSVSGRSLLRGNSLGSISSCSSSSSDAGFTSSPSLSWAGSPSPLRLTESGSSNAGAGGDADASSISGLSRRSSVTDSLDALFRCGPLGLSRRGMGLGLAVEGGRVGAAGRGGGFDGGGARGAGAVSESLDEEASRVVSAMEEILAPGPDVMEAAAAAAAAAAAGIALSGQPPADMAAAQREALYGNAGGSWGLRLALERKRVVRRVQRMAARARIPLPKALLPVPRYHTFGEQWFVTEEGALSPEEFERRQRGNREKQRDPQRDPQVSTGSPEPSDGVRGFFSFHRMVAYRQRHVDVINRLVNGHAVATSIEPTTYQSGRVTCNSSTSGSSCSSPPQSSPAAEVAGALAAHTAVGGGSSHVHGRVKLDDNLVPRIVVHRAVLRGALLAPRRDAAPPGEPASPAPTPPTPSSLPTRFFPGSFALSRQPSKAASAITPTRKLISTTSTSKRSTTTPARVVPSVAHMLSWMMSGAASRAGGSGSRRAGGADEPVRLDLEIEGTSLQYCRTVSVSLVRLATSVSPAPRGSMADNARHAVPFQASSSTLGGASPVAAMPYNAMRTQPSHARPPVSGMTVETEVPCDIVQVLYAQPYSDAANPPPLHPISLIRNSLHHMAGSLIRRCWLQYPFQFGYPIGVPGKRGDTAGGILGRGGLWRHLRFRARAAGETGGSSSGEEHEEHEDGKETAAGAATCTAPPVSVTDVPPAAATPSRLVLRVTLPRWVALGLLDGTLPGHLTVSARSDFHVVSAVPVVVQRARVAILGTSPYAASLVQAALAAPAALAAAELDEQMAATAAAAAASSATAGGTGGTAWLPPPLAWVLTSMRGSSRAAVSPGPSMPYGSMDFADATPEVGASLAVSDAPSQKTAAATPAWSTSGQRPLASAMVAATPRAAVHATPDATAASAAPQTMRPTHGSPQRARTATVPMAVEQEAPPPSAASVTAAGFGWSGSPAAEPTPLRSVDASQMRWKVGLGRLQWGFRQGLAAAALGAAAASAGGATGAVAAVGVAAALVSALGNVVVSEPESSTTFLTNAAITMTALFVAGVAATASALAGGEAAVLVAAGIAAVAAATAAAITTTAAAATSPVAAVGGAHASLPMSAATAAAAVAGPALAKARLLFPGLPAPLQAPRLISADAAQPPAVPSPSTAVRVPLSRASGSTWGPTPAASVPAPPRPGYPPVASQPRGVLRFAVAAGQVGGRPGGGAGAQAQARARGGAGSAGRVGAEMEPGGTTRVTGRGWSLWWRGAGQLAGEDGVGQGATQAAAAAAVATAQAASFKQPPPPPLAGALQLPPAWLRWQRTAGVGCRTRSLNVNESATTPDVTAACGDHVGGRSTPTTGRVLTPTATAAVAAFSSSSVRAAPNRPRLSYTVGWFPRVCRAAAAAAPSAPTSASAAAASAQQSPPTSTVPSPASEVQAQPQPQGAGGPTHRSTPLAQLRTRLLAGLRQGSGRVALPLPPVVIAEGLELCNVMVEPAPVAAAAEEEPGRAEGAGAQPLVRAAGKQHSQQWPWCPPNGLVTPGPGTQEPRAAPEASPTSGLPAAPVPAAQLWRWSRPGLYDSPAAAAGHPAPAGGTAMGAAANYVSTVASATATELAAAARGGSGLLPAAAVVGVAPYLAVRRMAHGLRRQVLQRGWWWRWLLGGVVGALLRPVALVGLLGKLPEWGLQALRRNRPPPAGSSTPPPNADASPPSQTRSLLMSAAGALDTTAPAAAVTAAGECSAGASEWAALVVVASCRDPLRVLRSRDMEELRNQAASAGCPVVPVVLTCARSPPGRALAARRVLAAACGAEPSAVRIVCVGEDLLHQPMGAIPRADLVPVWRDTAGCGGAVELRQAVRQAVVAAAAFQEAGPQLGAQPRQQQQQQQDWDHHQHYRHAQSAAGGALDAA